MNSHSTFLCTGTLLAVLATFLTFQIPNENMILLMAVLVTIFTLLLTYSITRHLLEKEYATQLINQRQKYRDKINRLKKEHDTSTLEKTIREGTRTLIKNSLDYFKLENIQNEIGASAAIQNLQLDKYGQIIELLADFSLILPDYQENQMIVQTEIKHQIDIYKIDEMNFSLFLERIMKKYEKTVSKKIKEKISQKEFKSLKTCPRCAERVLNKARICKHCKFEFSNSPVKNFRIDRIEKGIHLCDQGKFQEAVQSFEHEIKSKPNNARAYYFRALAYQKLGNRKQTFNDLKQSCELGHKKACELLRLKQTA